MNAADVLGLFSGMDLSAGEYAYLSGQATRIAYVKNLCQKLLKEIPDPQEMLDIGPHFLTRVLLETFPDIALSTLGIPFDKLTPRALLKTVAKMDLNDCLSNPNPFGEQKFDVIVFCEVVEHLFIPPDVVLGFLRNLLRDEHSVIVLGTPNAVCLANRMKMMLGINPFHHLVADWRSGAPHIREYTMAELRDYGRRAGLKVEFEEYCDYWGQSMHIDKISELESEIPSYRTGISIVYRSDMA